jgi:CubicO group peptidase (beta-lactamase class C family)
MNKMMGHFLFSFISILILNSYLFPQEINTTDRINIISLINKFSDKDPFINGEAIDQIVDIGSSSVDYLIKSLSDENDNVRWCSVIALYKIAPKGAKSIPFLVEALKDRNPNVRWCSAFALGIFGTAAAESVHPLLKLLNDDDRDVRWAAYISLSKIKKDAINNRPEISSIIEKLDILTPRLIKELKVPGVSISIIKNNKLMWSESFGVSDAIQKNKIGNKTIFEAASMSKPVFTYLVLKLVDQKKLDLDRPLSEYLPEKFISDNEDYSKEITARMILTHTSGMPNWRKGGEEIGAPIPIYYRPGTKFSYSGEGIYYLQRVIEHITQEPLEIYAKRNLFDKLGFESTSFIWTEKLNSQIATGHDTAGYCNKRSRYTHSNAAYTLYTTPDEYAKFIIEIMKENNSGDYSISEIMKNEMLKHQIRAEIRDVIDRPGRSLGLFSFRGLGWGIDSTITGDIIYHSGSNQTGFRCYSQFNIREGSGIVIMTNGQNGGELWSRLISIVGDL